MIVDLVRTYLCINREKGFVHIYLSHNGTPWHHSRRSLCGGKKYNKYARDVGAVCVCDKCSEGLNKITSDEDASK